MRLVGQRISGSSFLVVYSFKYTNKMQSYMIFFITIDAVHVSGGFSAHHQKLKNCTHGNWYMPSLLVATTSVGEFQLTHTSGSSKQAWHIPEAMCTVFELLMMSRESAWNMYSIDNNKEYCLTMHLVGFT